MDDLTPKLHELRFLKKVLPKLKRQAQSKGKKLYVRNGMIDPVPCVICGTIYDKYSGGNPIKHENCPSCRKKLEGGQTVLVCLVDGKGLYDGRYAFIESDNNQTAQKMAGQVIGVTPETMDLIELKQKLAELSEGQYIQICPKCKKEEVMGGNIPINHSLVQWPCPDCATKENSQVFYFDKNMNPIEGPSK